MRPWLVVVLIGLGGFGAGALVAALTAYLAFVREFRRMMH